MKKLLITLTLFGGLSLASAVQHVTTSFFASGVQNCQVTNTIGVTNLYSILAVGTTNVVGIIYTNAAGVQITTSTNDYNSVFAPIVETWVDSVGAYVRPDYDSTNVLRSGPYFNSIFIRLTGQSGANSAVTFRFFPIPDSEGLGGAHEDNVAADQILISVTATTTTEIRSLTKIDAQKLIGCKGLRLVSVTNADTDASSAITVLEIALVGWKP